MDMTAHHVSVIPAQAGIQDAGNTTMSAPWIPAFAGMTSLTATGRFE